MTGLTQAGSETKHRLPVRRRRWRSHMMCRCCGRVSVREGLCREHLHEWRYLTQRAILLVEHEDHSRLTARNLPV